MKRSFHEAGGMRWCIGWWGPNKQIQAEQGSPVVLLHGFTGDSRSWEEIATALSSYGEVIAPDLPGHGQTASPELPSAWRMPHSADVLADLLRQISPKPVIMVGYSMGGRFALNFALRWPNLVERLILISTSPGIADEEARIERQKQDQSWADILREQGIAPFVAKWEAQPLFSSQASLSPERNKYQRMIRLSQNPEALAASLRAWGTGFQEPLHEELRRIAVPAVAMAGALDEKFVPMAHFMATRMPYARAEIVSGVGHNVPLEWPEILIKVITHEKFQ